MSVMSRLISLGSDGEYENSTLLGVINWIEKFKDVASGKGPS